MLKLLGLFCLLSVSFVINANELPQEGHTQHMGVATCASSTCHGAVQKQSKAHVMKNEYTIWAKYDHHSRAYQTLLSSESKQIAEKLGLKNAHEAKVCLDCHADNVSIDMRGEKFQIEDGVGCEACHGGSEKWLASHANSQVSHEENITKGLYPTDDLQARAQLCLSCHYGNKDKFASHKIMGAGHPRLSFELDTFTVLQPAHYEVDKDYKERKNAPSHVQTWAVGMIETAKQMMTLVEETNLTVKGLFPELAFFDCHACHHPMSDKRWKKTEATGFIPTGTVRINDSPIVMTQTIAKQLDEEIYKSIARALKDFHKAAFENKAGLQKAAATILSELTKLENIILLKELTNADQKAILINILKAGNQHHFRDYIRAEQATMAIELLAISLGIKEQFSVSLDHMYKLVADDESFKADAYARLLGNMLTKL